MRAQRTGAPAADQDITTEVTFAKNLARWIVSLPARVVQRDSSGQIISAKVTTYDGPAHEGLPEGGVDVGFTTRIEALALTSALATLVYGDNLPDMTALGYHQRPGEDGWWITSLSHERLAGAPFGLVTRNARGFDSRVEYDPTRQYPERMIDALGNAAETTIDLRALQPSALTDANGVVTAESFDALGRVTMTVASGDTATMPSVSYAYRTDQLPYSLTTSTRLAHGHAATLDQTEYFDGRGRTMCSILSGAVAAGGGFIVSGHRTCNSRGFVAEAFAPFTSPDRAFTPAPPGTAKTSTRYDALGRVVEQTDTVAPTG